MSAHPFRRVARNLAAAALIGPGAALSRWGTRAMWPDDRPHGETEAAITRAAAALENGAEVLTRCVRDGTARPRDYKAFRRIALNFLDLRAVAVGDQAWLDQRRRDEERRFAQHVETAAALVFTEGPEQPERVLDPEESRRYDRGGPTS